MIKDPVAKNSRYFSELSRDYKKLLHRKKTAHTESELEKKIQESEKAPWKLFLPKSKALPSPIPPKTWQQHFLNLYHLPSPVVLPSVTTSILDLDETDWFNTPIDSQEILQEILRKPNRKAPGTDLICYEHLKQTLDFTLPLLTWIMNTCFHSAMIPASWKESLVFTLYKGKGSKNDPNFYRGIALLQTCYKIYTAILNSRLCNNVFHLLPPSQHGFQKGKSTEKPIEDLIRRIRHQLALSKGHLYVLFVDFQKAFDFVDRHVLFRKLRDQFQVKGRTLAAIRNLLEDNYLQITDYHTTSSPITQNKGVQQGDSLSPTLFLLYIADLSTALSETSRTEKAFFADDLEVDAPDKNEVQRALYALEDWCQENKILVNTNKTKVIKFRKGGRLARTDSFEYNGQEIEIVSSYEYLGLTLQSRLTFTEQVRKVKRKAMRALATIPNLHLVTTDCALRIFNIKIFPMVTYCLHLFSETLSVNQMLTLDQIKSAFVKKALCLHKSASSTLAHLMIGTPFLCEELRLKGFKFSNTAWREYDRYREERWLDIITTTKLDGPSFTSSSWRGSNNKKRHVTTRSTAHGFHSTLCCFLNCRSPQLDCRCVLCDSPIHSDFYHVLSCPASSDLSLSQFVAFLDSLS